MKLPTGDIFSDSNVNFFISYESFELAFAQVILLHSDLEVLKKNKPHSGMFGHIVKAT